MCAGGCDTVCPQAWHDLSAGRRDLCANATALLNPSCWTQGQSPPGQHGLPGHHMAGSGSFGSSGELGQRPQQRLVKTDGSTIKVCSRLPTSFCYQRLQRTTPHNPVLLFCQCACLSVTAQGVAGFNSLSR
jgi:hypothetical protein